MTDASMNIFDLIVLIVVGLSAMLSFFRGFVREVLSLFTWAGAVIITLYSFPFVSQWLAPQVGKEAANGLASIGTFFGALIVLTILTKLVSTFVKSGSEVGVLDNLFGLAFGAARGVLVVAIGYFVMTVVLDEKDYPEYVKHAKSRPYVAQAALLVGQLTPEYLNAVTDKGKRILKDEHDRIADERQGNTTLTHIKKTVVGNDDTPSNLPSIEDLQERLRNENRKH